MNEPTEEAMMVEDEQSLDANELLQWLFEQTREQALLLLDPQGIIVGWFKGAEQTFGYLAHEVLGQPVSMLFTPENLAAGLDKYERAVARTDIEAEDDRWMLRKDGSRFWANGVLSPIRNAGGQLVGFGKIVRNRTDLREQTETLTNQNESLKAAQERKNRFISALAHDLRNPLAGVANAVELLKVAGSDGETVTMAAEVITSSLATMRRLVDDLLEATRAKAGKIQLRIQREDLRQTIESAITACRPVIDKHTQNVHVFQPSTPLEVDIDLQRMQQVFVNLIENAANYTRHGGTIWVKVSMEGDEAVVKVEDSGVGISPETLPHIFDLFTQAEFAPDHSRGGLGIGLSVVKDLTQLHGGTVQVRSDGIGKGSEFTVRLPLAENRTGIVPPQCE